MNTVTSLKYAAILLPALSLGIPMANANDEECECPETDRTTAAVDTEREFQRTEERQDPTRTAQQQDPTRTDEQQDPTRTTRTTAQAESEASTRTFLASKPDRGYHSDSLVGREIVNRSTDESIGEVSDLVLDENGQVQAVIVSVGGVMGLGERDVAIAWDKLNRETEGDEVKLSVDMTQESLEDAPKYTDTETQTQSREQ